MIAQMMVAEGHGSGRKNGTGKPVMIVLPQGEAREFGRPSLHGLAGYRPGTPLLLVMPGKTIDALWTMEQALKRNIYVALGFLGILPVVGFFGSLAELAAVIFIAVTINSDTPLFRGWHDKFADTQVIKTR